jgi:hypothetical protein
VEGGRVTKKKLLHDILQNPARIYRLPGDVPRDRRFSDDERLEILQAWREQGAEARVEEDIDALIAELQDRTANNHAAE